MRVLVEGDDLHVWASFGALTIHGDERVEWRSPYHPQLDFAPSSASDVRLPPRLEGRVALDEGVLDALALPGDRVALARVGSPPFVEIVGVATGQIEHRIELVAAARPLGPEEVGPPAEPCAFEGSGRRGVRLFASPVGLIVTAAQSGHIAEWSLATKRFERVLSVPGAPENTLVAAADGELLHIALVESGRHSFLWSVDGACRLAGRWPQDREPRWGVPNLAVLASGVLTYSDEGPHRGKLALLSSELVEGDGAAHWPLPSSPTDLHAAGERFAALSSRHLVTGRVVQGRFVDVRVWTSQELLAAAGMEGVVRTPDLTPDGRGRRTFVEHRPSKLLLSGDTPILDGPEGAVLAVGPDGTRTLLPETELVDARHGVVLTMDKGRVRWVDVATGAVKRKEPAPLGAARFCRMLGDGLVHTPASEKPNFDFVPLVFLDPRTNKTKRLADEPRKNPGPRAIDGAIWWYEHEEIKEILSETIERGVKSRHVRVVAVEASLWCVGPDLRADSFELGRAIEDFAVHAGVPYVLVRDKVKREESWHLERAGEDGLERLTKASLPPWPRQLAAGAGSLLFLNDDGLHAFDLASGALRLLAPSSFGRLTELRVANGRAHWLEIANDQELAAVCSLEL